MKVMKFVAVALITSFILNSCGGGADGEIGDVSTATEIIGFNNEVIDYCNESGEKIEKAAEFSDDFAKIVSSKRDVRNTNGNFIFIGARLNSDKILENTPSSIPEDMKNNIKEMVKNYEIVKAANKVIIKYRKSQDFKDDDWKKGGESLAEMNEGITNYYKYKDLVLSQLSAISDKAEERILQDHPLKDPILAAKKDISSAKNLRNLLFSETMNRDSVQVAYDLLEKNSLQHKGEFDDALNEQNKKVYYDSFHESIEDYLGEIRKILRANKPLRDRDYNSISSDYESIISRYNSFVN